MNDLLIRVPAFARLDEYLGLWLAEPTRFAAAWDLAQSMDLATHVAGTPAPLKSALDKVPAAAGKSIAIIRVMGALMKQQSSLGASSSTVMLRREIRQAAADPDVAAILLAIDSPGGTVAGTDDLAAEVRAARKQKPVWAHAEDLAASAAYWIAAQAEHITANSNTALVGSIGTLMTVYDLSAAAEKEGVRTLVFATGPLKGAGTPGSKITDEQIAYFQGIIDQTQKSFDAAVQKGRSLTDKQLAAVRSGGVFTAPDALDRKLIDAIQPLSRTLEELTKA